MAIQSRSNIARDLKRLASRSEGVIDKALLKGAQRMAKELERNTPRESDGGPHLDTSVVYQKPKDGETFVGFSKVVSWRAHFVELGTINQRPQGFIERTQRQAHDEVFAEIQKELRKGLGL